MRIILASFVLIASASSGLAAPCLSRPDSAATHYNENQLGTTLCQQRVLDGEVELRQLQSNIEAELRNLQQQMELQRQMLQAQQALTPTLK